MNFWNRLLKRDYKYLNTIELSKSRLIHNYHYLSGLNKKIKVAPVLKSNAYGHGLTEIAKMIDDQGAPFLCVDSLHEAYQLYKANIKTPILIMGYINPENLKVKKLPFAYAVYDLDMARIIHKHQPHAHVHLKIDTGMHRLGVQIDELDNFLDQLPDLNIVGVMSHFASAKGAKDPLFQNQMKNFEKALQIIRSHTIHPQWIHIGASEAVLHPDTLQQVAKVSNLVRTGKALYGYAMTIDDKNLQPILQLKTHIAQIKKVKKGEKIGYDGTFTTKKETTLAILPIGYNDGVDRGLSNTGSVTINEISCPVIGRVSMNITTVDVTEVENPLINQEVIVISYNPHDPNSILQIAANCDTIPHEVLVHLAPSTRRIITE